MVKIRDYLRKGILNVGLGIGALCVGVCLGNGAGDLFNKAYKNFRDYKESQPKIIFGSVDGSIRGRDPNGETFVYRVYIQGTELFNYYYDRNDPKKSILFDENINGEIEEIIVNLNYKELSLSLEKDAVKDTNNYSLMESYNSFAEMGKEKIKEKREQFKEYIPFERVLNKINR